MQPLIQNRRHEIDEVCRRFHVRRLELFGSAAHGNFDPARSDVDLLVDFEPGLDFDAFECYFGLKEALETLLGQPIDLVVVTAVRNPYVKASIERSKELLFAA